MDTEDGVRVECILQRRKGSAVVRFSDDSVWETQHQFPTGFDLTSICVLEIFGHSATVSIDGDTLDSMTVLRLHRSNIAQYMNVLDAQAKSLRVREYYAQLDLEEAEAREWSA